MCVCVCVWMCTLHVSIRVAHFFLLLILHNIHLSKSNRLTDNFFRVRAASKTKKKWTTTSDRCQCTVAGPKVTSQFSWQLCVSVCVCVCVCRGGLWTTWTTKPFTTLSFLLRLKFKRFIYGNGVYFFFVKWSSLIAFMSIYTHSILPVGNFFISIFEKFWLLFLRVLWVKN